MNTDNVVKKCNGVIGMLARAAPHLPRELLRSAYIALARVHLDYSCAIFASASKSQLSKLDTVQRIAARVICQMPRDTHSEPLLKMLQLESLSSRRAAHVDKVVEAVLTDTTTGQHS